MDVQLLGGGLVDRIQKLAEFEAAVPPMALPGHPAGFQVQGCE
jgi:hypothetical protein